MIFHVINNYGKEEIKFALIENLYLDKNARILCDLYLLIYILLYYVLRI